MTTRDEEVERTSKLARSTSVQRTSTCLVSKNELQESMHDRNTPDDRVDNIGCI
jgi:hypothetical protein